MVVETKNVSIVQSISNQITGLTHSIWTPQTELECVEVKDAPVMARIFVPVIDLFLVYASLFSLYHPNGWIASASNEFHPLVQVMLFYILPVVVAYRTGKVLYSFRGGLYAVAATAGLLGALAPVQSFGPSCRVSVAPAFAYAMVVVPVFRLVDYLYNRLVDMTNLQTTMPLLQMFGMKSLFIVFGVFAPLLADQTAAPIFDWVITALGNATESLLDAWPPLASIMVETAKVLFANEDIATKLASLALTDNMYYTIESNPGPATGALLAALVAGPRVTRVTIPFAIVLVLVGGAQTAYFPYVYMLPQLLIALILGGMTSTLIFDASNVGFTARPTPPTLMQIADVTPSGDAGVVVAALLTSALVSFLVAWFLLALPIRNARVCWTKFNDRMMVYPRV